MACVCKRTRPDGRVVYQVQVRVKGAAPQTKTFKRKRDADHWADCTETAVRRGLAFPGEAVQRRTLAEAIDKYIDTVMPGKRANTAAAQRPQLVWWKKRLGHLSMSAVTPAVLSEARDALITSQSRHGRQMNPATCVRYLAALSHVLTVACKEWGWIPINPCMNVSRPKESRGRVRFLSDDERAALLDACRDSGNPHLYVIVVLALSTGMRQSEILNLDWSRVDLERGLIILDETKNGERRGIPLMSHAAEVMREHSKVRRPDTTLVFPAAYRYKKKTRPISIRSAFQSACQRAKLENFKFHDCRHSCASYLAMNGATLAEIAEVLGHKTLQMVKRYSHLSLGHTAKVLGRMNDAIFNEPDGAEEGAGG